MDTNGAVILADLNASYAIKMLHYHGFITRTDVTSRFVGWDKIGDIGRCDVFAARMGKAVSIEIKNGKTSFQLDHLREPQREWAEWTMKEPYCVEYYIYLTIGKNPPNWSPGKYIPKVSWLIPYQSYLEVEEKVNAIQKSIPYRAGKGMRKEIQENKLDALTLYKPWELVWKPNNSLIKPEWLTKEETGITNKYGGFWIIPDTHIFYKKYIQQEKSS